MLVIAFQLFKYKQKKNLKRKYTYMCVFYEWNFSKIMQNQSLKIKYFIFFIYLNIR
jgi:hypothetical protein